MTQKTNLFFCCLISLTILTAGCRYLETPLKKPVTPPDVVLEHNLVAEILMHLQLDYIDSEKLEPELLLEGALIELERMVPEVWVKTQLPQSTNIKTLKVKTISYFLENDPHNLQSSSLVLDLYLYLWAYD